MRLIATAIAAILILVGGTLVCVFVWARLSFPPDVDPPDSKLLPPEVHAAFWRDFGGETDEHRSLSPFALPVGISRIVCGHVHRDPQLTIVGQAAKHFLWRSDRELRTLERHVVELVASFWISTFWTADQALTEIATKSYFGQGLTGFEAASRGYFGRPPARLGQGEVAALVAISRAPSRWNLWCEPDRFLADLESRNARLGTFTRQQVLGRLVSPPRPCS